MWGRGSGGGGPERVTWPPHPGPGLMKPRGVRSGICHRIGRPRGQIPCPPAPPRKHSSLAPLRSVHVASATTNPLKSVRICAICVQNTPSDQARPERRFCTQIQQIDTDLMSGQALVSTRHEGCWHDKTAFAETPQAAQRVSVSSGHPCPLPPATKSVPKATPLAGEREPEAWCGPVPRQILHGVARWATLALTVQSAARGTPGHRCSPAPARPHRDGPPARRRGAGW